MNEPKQFGSTSGATPSAKAKPAPAPARPAGSAAKPTSESRQPSGVAAAKASDRPQRPGTTTSALPGKPSSTQPQPATGKVVYDERGNAVWDWLKQTGRNAIESTTRLLRKLEAPDLKVEQPEEEELRIQPDGGTYPGGGYDPYNQPIKSRRTPTK